MASIVEIIREAQLAEQATDQAAAAAKAKTAKAEQAAAAVDQAAAAAAAAEQQARAKLNTQYTSVLRTLTADVRHARDDAAAAIRDGGDAISAWVAYRKLRATNRGKWEAIKSEYQRATGHRPPPGDWGPPLQPDPTQTLPAETFQDFLQAVTAATERDVEGAEYGTTWDEILAARGLGK